MVKTEAQKMATRKYNDKKYARINFFVLKEKKAVLQAYAQSKGESLNGFINRAIKEAMEREGAAPDDSL